MSNYYVIVIEKNGKFCAFAETIQHGNNLCPIIKRYNAKSMFSFRTRQTAEYTALMWNEVWKQQGKYFEI